MRSALSLAALFTIPLLNAQESSRTVAEGSIAGYATVKTHVFDVRLTDEVSVESSGDAGRPYLISEVFSADSVLIEKEQAKNRTQALPFTWRADTAGSYYLRLRNLTKVSGAYRVTVTPRGVRPSDGEPRNFAEMRVFYASNRKPTGDGRPQYYYGKEPEGGDNLHYGELSVSIPREHGMGELEGPTVFRVFSIELGQAPNPQRHIVILRLVPEDRDVFFKRLAQRVQVSERKWALIFIHGFNVSFNEAARRTAQIAYDLRYDGAPIFFSWPSQGDPSFAPHIPTLPEYIKDGEYNNLSITALVRFLDDVRTRTGATSLHVIAHSMGNRLLTSALEALAAKTKRPQKAAFTDVALMAPDISSTVFRHRAPRFVVAAKRLTLYGSSKDRALIAAQHLSGGPRAGQGGKDMLVIPGIESIDASAVDTSLIGLSHGYYADSSSIIHELDQLFLGIPVSKRLDLQKTKNLQGSYYWQFGPIRH